MLHTLIVLSDEPLNNTSLQDMDNGITEMTTLINDYCKTSNKVTL